MIVALKDQIEEIFFAELERRAKAMGLDEMYFGVTRSEFTKDGLEISGPAKDQLNKLETLCIQEISDAGLYGRWTKERGWIK